MLYDNVVQAQKRLEQEIDFIEKRLRQLPEGKLICTGSVEHPRFYQHVGSVKKYIAKQNYEIVEHFGRVDDESYQKSVCYKLQLYMHGDILPSANLIITWESKEKPLTLREIQHVIQTHFT